MDFALTEEQQELKASARSWLAGKFPLDRDWDAQDDRWSELEELGWTGFVMPRLRQRYGVLTTGLIMGVLWGAWHFPLFSGSARVSGLSPSFFLAVLLFSWLPAFRVLMVWVYDRTGSLLLVMLMHAPLAAGSLILLPAAISPVHTVVFDLVFGAVLWLAAGAVLAGPARPGSMTARCA